MSQRRRHRAADYFQCLHNRRPAVVVGALLEQPPVADAVSQPTHPRLAQKNGVYETLPKGAVIVLSEPLDELNEHWEAVPESSCLVLEDGKVTISPFSPK